jgi:hypothetical protein
MDERPLLLLDIDGVLCPVGDVLPSGCELLTCEGTEVFFDGRNIDRLRRLGACFTLCWASSWEEHANRRLGPAHGLPPLPVVLLGDSEDAETETWKLPAIVAFAGVLPLAWVDDDLWEDAFAWARDRRAAGIPTLLVRPDSWRGLTEEQTQQLLTFAASSGQAS